MPKIEFVVDHKVQQHDGKGPEYKAGQVYDLHISYAEKYKRLGYAVDHVEKAKPAPVAAAPVFSPPIETVNETPEPAPETSGTAPLLAREDNTAGRHGSRRR